MLEFFNCQVVLFNFLCEFVKPLNGEVVMKKLLIILSLFVVVGVQAANSDGHKSELQRALARRRTIQGETSSENSAPIPAPRPTRNSGRVVVPPAVAGVFGQATPAAGQAPVPRPRRVKPSFNMVDELPAPDQNLLNDGGDTSEGSSTQPARQAPAPQLPRTSVARRVPPEIAAKPPVCTICGEMPSKNEKIVLGQCKHSFCKECIKPWVTRGGQWGQGESTCPNCRQGIHALDLIKIKGSGVVAAGQTSGVLGSNEQRRHDLERPLQPQPQAAAIPVNSTYYEQALLRHRPAIDRGLVTAEEIRAMVDVGMNPQDYPLSFLSTDWNLRRQMLRMNQIERGMLLTNTSDVSSTLGQLPNLPQERINTFRQATDTFRREMTELTQQQERARNLARAQFIRQQRQDEEQQYFRRIEQREAARRDGRPMLSTPIRIGGVSGLITQDGILNLDNKSMLDVSGLQRLSVADKAKVKRLSLRNNAIQNLPSGVFSGFPNLVEIDLTGNPFEGDVSPYVMTHVEIQRLQRLRGLDLSELLEIRQMLNLPREMVPVEFHRVYDRMFAKEIIEKLIELTLNG